MIKSCDNKHSFLSGAHRRCPWCEMLRLRSELADAMAAIDRLHEQRRELEAERDALREDAERYRWLLNNVTWFDPASNVGPKLAPVCKRIFYHASDAVVSTLSEAIDAARKA